MLGDGSAPRLEDVLRGFCFVSRWDLFGTAPISIILLGPVFPTRPGGALAALLLGLFTDKLRAQNLA